MVCERFEEDAVSAEKCVAILGAPWMACAQSSVQRTIGTFSAIISQKSKTAVEVQPVLHANVCLGNKIGSWPDDCNQKVCTVCTGTYCTRTVQ